MQHILKTSKEESGYTILLKYEPEGLDEIMKDYKSGVIKERSVSKVTIFFPEKNEKDAYNLCNHIKTIHPFYNTTVEIPEGSVLCEKCRRNILQTDCWAVKDLGETTYECKNVGDCVKERRKAPLIRIVRTMCESNMNCLSD